VTVAVLVILVSSVYFAARRGLVEYWRRAQRRDGWSGSSRTWDVHHWL